MAYSAATLKKVTNMLNVKIEQYKVTNPDHFKVCISKGNIKIGKVMNFSIAPIITCGHRCAHCMGICYDIKACAQYPNTVIDARARNTALMMNYRDILFDRIDNAMNHRRANKYFRWHVSGDIYDFDYFCRMVENARNHSDFVIWTYTKQYEIVNQYCDMYGRDAIPANFSIMFSKWDGVEMVNPYNFPVFACKLKDGNVDTSEDWFAHTYKCPGNCDVCKKACRGCVVGESAWCDEH